MTRVLDQCRTALGGWLAGMTLSATTVFLLTWLGLVLLHAPLALLSALVCGLLTFVPTIGPTAATLLPLSMALLVSPALMLQVLVMRLVLQNLEAFLLTPLLLRRTVNLLPTVALMAQLSLGALLGLPGVLLALAHDVVIVCGVFAWLGLAIGLEVNSLFAVALLTIAGYSVNDTVVVFDRIRERQREDGDLAITDQVDRAVSATLTRTIYTSGTTLLPLLALILFGGATLYWFAIALALGVIVGSWSSIALAPSLLTIWSGASRSSARA